MKYEFCFKIIWKEGLEKGRGTDVKRLAMN